MPTLYDRIQGRSVDRLAALSDGIFAGAMTLLVLDPHLPTAAQVHPERGLLLALCTLAPQWLAYAASFLGLGVLLLAVSFVYQKDWLNVRGQQGDRS